MTAQEKQNAFCSNISHLIAEKKDLGHHPDGRCMHGACTTCVSRGYNWMILWELSTTFWKTAPEVDDEWAWDVRRTRLGYTVEELHDIMVGVFMGSDRPDKRLRYQTPGYTPYTVGGRP